VNFKNKFFFQILSGVPAIRIRNDFTWIRQKVSDPTGSGSTTLPKTMSENVLIVLFKKSLLNHRSRRGADG
jgi:hypothetical protein